MFPVPTKGTLAQGIAQPDMNPLLIHYDTTAPEPVVKST